MDFVDLHCHSSCSDGTLSPQELINSALKIPLVGLALTDHDTVDGLDDFLAHGKKCGMQVISGIELSAGYAELPLHILGYGFDHHHNQFLATLHTIQQDRKRRNKAIIQKLQDIGIPISYDDMQKIAGHGQIGRPHFAAFLVRRQHARNFQHAFDLFLRKGGAAYVARQVLSAEMAINTIVTAGGIAVLAHPTTLQLPWEQLVETIELLRDMGLGGIECYYPTHSVKFRRKLQMLCSNHHLVITGGSDYHGDIRPNTRLGCLQKKQRVPASILTALIKQLAQT